MVWYGQEYDVIYVMYEMIMFVIFHDLRVDEYGNRQEPYGCLYYCMTCVSILKRHVIALLYCYVLAIVVVALRGGGNRGDGTMMMDITPVRWRWRSKAQRKGYTISHIMNCM